MMKPLHKMVAVALLLALLAVMIPVGAQEGPPPPHRGGGEHQFGGHPDGPPPPHGEGGPFGPGGPPQDGRPGPRDGGPGAEFMAEVMMARMSKELELSDEQTVLMVRRFSDLREKIKNIRRQRGDVTRELDEMLGKATPDAAKTQALLQTIISLDEQVASERKTAFEEISKDLDPVKQARLYLFLDRFEADMRRMIGEARERFQGRRPNGPPPREGGPGGEFGPPPGPGGEFGPPPGPGGEFRPPPGLGGEGPEGGRPLRGDRPGKGPRNDFSPPPPPPDR